MEKVRRVQRAWHSPQQSSRRESGWASSTDIIATTAAAPSRTPSPATQTADWPPPFHPASLTEALEIYRLQDIIPSVKAQFGMNHVENAVASDSLLALGGSKTPEEAQAAATLCLIQSGPGPFHAKKRQRGGPAACVLLAPQETAPLLSTPATGSAQPRRWRADAAAAAQAQLPGSCTADLSNIGVDVAAPEVRERKRARSASPDAMDLRHGRRFKDASQAAPAPAPPPAPQPAPAAFPPAPHAPNKAVNAPASKHCEGKKSGRGGKHAPRPAKAAAPAPAVAEAPAAPAQPAPVAAEAPAAPAQPAPVQLAAAAEAEGAPATELQTPKLPLRVKIGMPSFLAMERGLYSPRHLPGLAEPQPATVSLLPDGHICITPPQYSNSDDAGAAAAPNAGKKWSHAAMAGPEEQQCISKRRLFAPNPPAVINMIQV